MPSSSKEQHVTTRKRAEDLDSDNKIFKEHDNVEPNCKEETYFTFEKSLRERLAVPPSKKSPLQHQSVSNIKGNLKRPHSREQQELSPASKVERNEEDRARRCLEFKVERLQSPNHLKRSYMTCMNRNYTHYMLWYLLKVQRKPLGTPTSSRIPRACVINWLMSVNGHLGNPAIIQSACWYLDSFLGIEYVELDRLQLVAAACYWIARKLHGPKVPASWLVKCADFAFSTKGLLAAEKLVLKKLAFPIQPVIPQEFITYLAWCCDSANPEEIELAATFICMSGLMMGELCEEYPSVIACAAVRSAMILLKKKDMLKHLVRCPMYRAVNARALSLSHTGSILQRAVLTIADQTYKYKAPLEHYGMPPHCMAQKIINAARQ